MYIPTIKNRWMWNTYIEA